ncbi:membrane protein [Hallella multisaccharivorax DSM 17128]|uniref:EamA domain-containing protein n=1 Tax=Hallella multisaccharivorax DSM 17128 TaxID=688246 RepID=F8N854_9BACT|nr:DMT family transporter [Hallella multisaccharivorax]EGN56492.1 protein of unknown function DUF6 transmembrane [Hallella multisaccharivorax DSM 17128]GJG30023.1 membrane protein [Hallella multisaccharivorax DSM 17128]
MGNNKPLQAHLSLLSAEIFWGLLAPLGKDVMLHGVDNVSLVSFRVAGAALLFWFSSLFVKERMPWRHVLLMAGAALLGVVFNQCLYTVGLSFTSPVNSSIVTTSMPIFAMVLSFFILREPLTWMKVGGVAMGCAGAVFLILSSAHSGGKTGNIWGDLMCMGAQLSFALYLTLYNPLIRKYNVVTVNKWMFTWSCLFLLPFTGAHVSCLSWQAITPAMWLEVGYVVIFGTFLSYLLAVVGQRILRPTVVSVYNYVQPVVSVVVSVLTGLSVFTVPQGLAVILIFSGVWLVVRSKSKRDLVDSNNQ